MVLKLFLCPFYRKEKYDVAETEMTTKKIVPTDEKRSENIYSIGIINYRVATMNMYTQKCKINLSIIVFI